MHLYICLSIYLSIYLYMNIYIFYIYIYIYIYPPESELDTMFRDVSFPEKWRSRFRAFLRAIRLLLHPPSPHAGTSPSLTVAAAPAQPTPYGGSLIPPHPC